MSRRGLLLLLFLVEIGFGAVPLLMRRDTDFTAYARAADALVKGVDPYLDEAHPYLYPPLLAVALTPFHALPARAAAWLWMFASAALLAFAAARLSRGAKNEDRIILVAIFFAPFAATQWNTQANAFLLAMLVLARERLDNGKDLAGGCALGLAVALKPLALLGVAGLLLAGRLRAASVCALTIAASFLLVVPFLGWTGVPPSVRHVCDILLNSWPAPYAGNISLNGSLDRLFPAGAGEIRHRVVGGVLLGMTALLVLAAASRGRLLASRVIDAFLAATLLGAGSSWLHQSAALFPLASTASPGIGIAAAGLYAVAAGWRLARDGAGSAAASAAALAGTAAIAVLWVSGLRRLSARDGR